HPGARGVRAHRLDLDCSRRGHRPHRQAGDERRPDTFPRLASLASAPNTDIKVFATGLGVGILLDATLIRALLLPALVAGLGRWNWWMPGLPARLLGIEPSTVAATDTGR